MNADDKMREMDIKISNVSVDVKDELTQIKRYNELILQAAGEGIYGLNCDGITTFVNPAAARMLGWEVEELIGQPMHKISHHSRADGEHYPKEECPVYAAFKDGAVHHVDNEVYWRKDGSSFPVEYTSTPIREAEELVGAVVVFKDISERKRADDEIRQSEERFRRLFEFSADAIFLLDPAQDGKIIDCNQKACELLGYTREQLMMMQISDIHPHEMPRFLAFAESVISKGSGQTEELCCQTNDGQKVPAEISASVLIEDEGRQLVLSSVRDITERVQAQQAITQLQQQNEQILHAAGEGIYGLDAKGMTTFVNPAAAEILGWDVDDLIGQPMHKISHHSHADGAHYPKEECPVYASLKDGVVHHVDNEVYWRKDGSSFPVEYTSTPIREAGELTGAVVVFKDISERKKAEQELMEAHAEVEHMKERLEAENVYLQEEIRSRNNFKDIIGESDAIQAALHQIELVAPTYATVLITGESGTGKELFARAIHERSDRSDRPLIRVNCAAIPSELFESEFFGHIKGAFTGAVKNRAGRFELADGGTIFLDEVGEIPLELQSKLLRVLQEGQFERVGEEKTCKVDVRVIAATNRDLAADVEAGNFRQDLFYRLNVFPLEAVPLRDRAGDITLLAQYFIDIVSNKLKRKKPQLRQANIQQLQVYDWPGNIRELQNVIERAIIVSQDDRLQFQLPGAEKQVATTTAETVGIAPTSGEVYTEAERLAQDKANIETALRQADGKISGKGGAAELLGIKSTTLASRMKKLGVNKPS